MITSWIRRPAVRLAAEGAVVLAACLWLSPIDTRTMFAAAAEYVRTQDFGPYDRIVVSQLNQRPFEQCPGVAERHVEVLRGIERALPEIEASSRFEPIRLVRLIQRFNRDSQAFYRSECPQAWTYYYSYADYQSWMMKVAPIVWLVEVGGGSEIYLVAFLMVGAWVGIGCLFWIARRLSGSSLVAAVTLLVLGFSLFVTADLRRYVDVRLNLLNTFVLVAAAQWLCEFPSCRRRVAGWAVELGVAAAFALAALGLLFLRLPTTRLDATVLIAVMFAVAAVRRDLSLARRAAFVLILVTALQWPFQQFSSRLLGPISSVNTAAAEEFKLVNAVQFLNERPSHFGNFILDYNFTWVHDSDFYLRRLSPVQNVHHAYPAWGRNFLMETVLQHPTELPNAWWKRFAMQVGYHRSLSYGIYGGYADLGTAAFWLATGLGAVIVMQGRRSLVAWPLIGLVFWEVFGLHTFLALMHVHNLYFLKGLALLWCALPCLAVFAARGVAERLRSNRPSVAWAWLASRRRGWLVAGAVVLMIAGGWMVREVRKESHATRIWRAVHAGLIERETILTPDALVTEIEAIRDLGGDAPGTVSMYGAWALFGYRERIPSYVESIGKPIDTGRVTAMMFAYYQRALAEDPGNPHFYTYARYFADPEWPAVYEEALRRFPQHPYRVMMTWALGTESQDPPGDPRAARNQARYDVAVREQLQATRSFRPGLRPLPDVSATSPAAITEEGIVATAGPGETVLVEPFRTMGTDRLALGVFLRVTEGTLGGQLIDEGGKRLGDLPVMSSTDVIGYRAWHFSGLTSDRPGAEGEARLALIAGPQGARFVVRDLYPLIENPRWFR